MSSFFANEGEKKQSLDDSFDRAFCNEAGFGITNNKLCSILIHPIGMLLTTYLNDVSPPTMVADFYEESLKITSINREMFVITT